MYTKLQLRAQGIKEGVVVDFMTWTMVKHRTMIEHTTDWTIILEKPLGCYRYNQGEPKLQGEIPGPYYKVKPPATQQTMLPTVMSSQHIDLRLQSILTLAMRNASSCTQQC